MGGREAWSGTTGGGKSIGVARPSRTSSRRKAKLYLLVPQGLRKRGPKKPGLGMWWSRSPTPETETEEAAEAAAEAAEAGAEALDPSGGAAASLLRGRNG